MRDFQHSLPMELLRARESAMSRFRPMLRDHDLTEQQWRTIRTLAAYNGIDASELARRSFLLSPSLTRILQFLEREGIIRRSSDVADQRRSVFFLTSKGRKIYTSVASDTERIYIDMERNFGLEKMEMLYELLADFSSMKASDEKKE
jgi:homoprotocatechuate degradation regulator HpaR